MSHLNSWQEVAHVSEYHPNGKAIRKAAFWTMVGIGAVYGISALTGFKPGMDMASTMLQGKYPNKPF